MAYTPVNGLEINGDFGTSGTYAPANGLEINGDFSGTTPPEPVYQRALLSSTNVFLRQIEDSELSTGKKPYVFYNGVFKIRSTTEGTPVILDGTSMRLLLNSETLRI